MEADCGVSKGQIPQILQKLAPLNALRQLKRAAVRDTPHWQDGELKRFRGHWTGDMQTVAAHLCMAQIKGAETTMKKIGHVMGVKATTIENYRETIGDYIRDFRLARRTVPVVSEGESSGQ
jgi:hypothetical protein